MILDIFPKAAKLQFPAFYGWLPLPQEWSADQFAAARGRSILVTPRIAAAVGKGDSGASRICLGAPRIVVALSDVRQTLRDILARHAITLFLSPDLGSRRPEERLTLCSPSRNPTFDQTKESVLRAPAATDSCVTGDGTPE